MNQSRDIMTEENATQPSANQGISWKQGLLIAMGVPILIVPSLADISYTLYAMSILIWVISVVSGFFLNLNLGEMCATFRTPGIAGSIQYMFTDDEKYKGKKINTGRLLSAVGAWCYFNPWITVVPIFTIMAAEYIFTLVPDFFGGIDYWTKIGFYLLIGLAMYAFIIFSGRKGLEGGAKVQLILTIFTIVPIVVICIAPLVMGHFHLDYVVNEMTPPGWAWDGNGILMILGCLTVAQWSAVGWETAAAYGAEYKDPSHDVPKALMSCGLACLALYFLIGFCMYGTLGGDYIYNSVDAGTSTYILKPIADMCFGTYGGIIAVICLIIGMVMVVQTAFLGASMTIKAMAEEGSLPYLFADTNEYGVPMKAMYFEAFIGVVLIISGATASQILAVCAFSYCVCHAMCQLAFIKSRRDPRFKDVERVYKVPTALYYSSFVVIGFEIALMIGIMYYLYMIYDITYALMGPLFAVLYIPCWMIFQWWNSKHHPELPCGMDFGQAKE